MNKQVQFPVIALSLLLLGGPLIAQQPAVNEFYQDFRNKRPLSDDFRFRGFDPDNEMKPENEGLRVTLPAERGKHDFFEVIAGFPLEADFELTATYEILAAKQPLKGYGVGVNLTISTETQPRKFGKLCRVLRAKDGSVYVAEMWPKFKNKTKPTEVRAGQLRLARIGPALHYLVSDGPGQAFEQIWEVKDYGTDVVTYAGFQVGDSGEPGNPVDARIIDLRFRLGKIELAKAATPAPLAVPAPADENVPPRPLDNVPRWFMALIVAGYSSLFCW
jgi:hypothetical protein